MALAITLKRTGVFSVHAEDYSGQCGRLGQTVVRYNVIVRGNKLNPQGWLLDNTDIPSYFETTFRNVQRFPSCEEMAQTACKDLCAMAEKGGAFPDYVRVGITVIEDSEISAEWRR